MIRRTFLKALSLFTVSASAAAAVANEPPSFPTSEQLFRWVIDLLANSAFIGISSLECQNYGYCFVLKSASWVYTIRLRGKVFEGIASKRRKSMDYRSMGEGAFNFSTWERIRENIIANERAA